jgi:periplasmic protein TonB
MDTMSVSSPLATGKTTDPVKAPAAPAGGCLPSLDVCPDAAARIIGPVAAGSSAPADPVETGPAVLTIVPEPVPDLAVATTRAPRLAGTALSALTHAVAVAAALVFVAPPSEPPLELPTIDVAIVEPAAEAPAAASAAAEAPTTEQPQPVPPDPVAEAPPPEERQPVQEVETAAAPTTTARAELPVVELDPPAIADIVLPAELMPPVRPPEPPVVPPVQPQPAPPQPAPPRRPEARRPPDTHRPRRPPAPSAPSVASAGQGVTSDGRRSATPPPSYLGLVMARLHRAKVYPQSERDSGRQGQVSIRFTITRSGAATGVALVRSSGNAVLDQAAMAMVHRAAPFPPLPAEFGPSVMTLTAPIGFSLR